MRGNGSLHPDSHWGLPKAFRVQLTQYWTAASIAWAGMTELDVILMEDPYHQCGEVVAEKRQAGRYHCADLVLYVQEVAETDVGLQALDEGRYALQDQTSDNVLLSGRLLY